MLSLPLLQVNKSEKDTTLRVLVFLHCVLYKAVDCQSQTFHIAQSKYPVLQWLGASPAWALSPLSWSGVEFSYPRNQKKKLYGLPPTFPLMKMWKKKALLDGMTPEEERAVSCSTWVLGIKSSAQSHFLWPMCSAKRVGALLSGGLLKLAAFMQNISVTGPAEKQGGNGWVSSLPGCVFLAVRVTSSSTATIHVLEHSRLAFCVLLGAEVDAWWMVDHISACSLPQFQDSCCLSLPGWAVMSSSGSSAILPVPLLCLQAVFLCPGYGRLYQGVRKK